MLSRGFPCRLRSVFQPKSRLYSPRTVHRVPLALLPVEQVGTRNYSSYAAREQLFLPRRRWLCNEEQEHSIRRTPFDIDALQAIACRSVGAARCHSWNLMREGPFKRAFLLDFDNDARAVVQVPCPGAGNVEQATASEVATLCYLREIFPDNESSDIRTVPPRVLAWDASFKNPAKTPYIVLEHVPGVPLSSRWPVIEGRSAAVALASIAFLESVLLTTPLGYIGSLCFPEQAVLNGDVLYSPPDKALPKYGIGPTVDRNWWRGQYAHVDAHRGPWLDFPSMVCSAAELQLGAIDHEAYLTHVQRPLDTALLCRLLSMCVRAAPSIIPSQPLMSEPVLSHPNLQLDSLMVPAEGDAYVQHVVDWQGATVAPFFTRCAMPPAVAYDESDEQAFIRMHHRYACRVRGYYHDVISELQPKLRGEVVRLPQASALANMVPLMTRCVADGPMQLRGLLMELQEKWDAITDAPCPIDFSAEERAAHAEDETVHGEYSRNVAELCEEIGCLADGSVAPERYEAAKIAAERRAAEWDEVAMKGPFPFYEGAYSYYLA
ncbi:hypothetical protein C8Q80DRAFT_1113819 [Daedaleopsis nitida]|nr:hypothetical protein C8Q80DRAFT_1113819 [Daedaleopsis nitida]